MEALLAVPARGALRVGKGVTVAVPPTPALALAARAQEAEAAALPLALEHGCAEAEVVLDAVARRESRALPLALPLLRTLRVPEREAAGEREMLGDGDEVRVGEAEGLSGMLRDAKAVALRRALSVAKAGVGVTASADCVTVEEGGALPLSSALPTAEAEVNNAVGVEAALSVGAAEEVVLRVGGKREALVDWVWVGA